MIRVAKNGYAGTCYSNGSHVMLINGVLHQSVSPVDQAYVLWVPVREHIGPVEYVDVCGRPCPAPTEGEDRG